MEERKFKCTLKEAKNNYKIISEFVKKYKKELIEFQSNLVEKIGIMSSSEYKELMLSLPEDVYVGIMLEPVLGDCSDMQKVLETGDIQGFIDSCSEGLISLL